MTDRWVTFEAQITPVEWGTSHYTVLPIPDWVIDELGKTRRVEGEINDHPVNLAITRAPVLNTAFLWTGKSLLKAADLVPGEMIEVRLRPVAGDLVDTPTDVAASLRAAGQTAAWEALTPGKKRSALHRIETAKRSETRAKRIAELTASLAGG